MITNIYKFQEKIDQIFIQHWSNFILLFPEMRYVLYCLGWGLFKEMPDEDVQDLLPISVFSLQKKHDKSSWQFINWQNWQMQNNTCMNEQNDKVCKTFHALCLCVSTLIYIIMIIFFIQLIICSSFLSSIQNRCQFSICKFIWYKDHGFYDWKWK